MNRMVIVMRAQSHRFGSRFSLFGGTLSEIEHQGTPLPNLQVGAIELPQTQLDLGLSGTSLVLIQPPMPDGFQSKIDAKEGEGVTTVRGKVNLPDQGGAMTSFVVIDEGRPFFHEMLPDNRSAKLVMGRLKSVIPHYRSSALLSLYRQNRLLGLIGIAPRSALKVEVAAV